jgi:hypothetical protein
MTINLNVTLSVVKRGPLDLTAYATRSTVVGNQGVVFWLDGPDLRRIGIEKYEVEWNMGETRDLVVFPQLETIWPDQYETALRAIGGLTMGVYRGPICAHCFGGHAGAYQVTCTIRNRAGVAQTILAATITKQDPDTVYAGTDTICYSTSGNFTGAPSGAEQITVADGLVTRAIGASANKRILFRTGETFSQSISPRGSNGMYVGTFGGTAPANLTRGFLGNTGAGPHQDYTFDNLLLDLGYDPAAANDWWNEGTAPTEPETGFLFTSGATSGVTLCGCMIRGADIGAYMVATESVVFDCGITDYFDFGMFDLREKTAVVGTFIAQNPLALNVKMSAGGESLPSNRNSWNTTVLGDTAAAIAAFAYFGPLGEAPNWPRHGPYRMSTHAVNTLNRSAFINSQPGWSGHPQPAIRYMRESTNIPDVYGTVIDSYLKGGFTVATINELGADPANFVLLDGNIFEGDENMWNFIDFFMGNVWLRNCLFLLPSTVTIASAQSYADIVRTGSTTGIFGDGCAVESCTFAYAANLATRSVQSNPLLGGEAITYRNNLLLNTATNAGAVTVPSGTLQKTSLTGFNADLSPEAGNTDVVGVATGVAPVVDLDGNTRETPGAIGALEP